MSLAAVDQHMVLAKLAHEETGRGIYEDKAIKNLYASEYIWNSIKDNKTVGIIGEDKEKGLTYVAEPIGVICGVTPTTNPTSTTIFKAMIAIKTGNQSFCIPSKCTRIVEACSRSCIRSGNEGRCT